MSHYAMFRLPYATMAYRVEQKTGEPLRLLTASDLDGVRGFVVAPFVASPSTPIVVIEGEAEAVSLHARPDAVCGVEHADRNAYAHDFAVFHGAVSQGRFGKIVLSRSAEVATPGRPSPEGLFAEACRRYPRMMITLVSSDVCGTWLMATPETLLRREGSLWRTLALAGTMRHVDGEQTEPWSEKNISEQKLVADYVAQTLTRFAGRVEIGEPYTVRAGNLLHLRSDFSFSMADNGDYGIGDIVEALHPTPAVCGLPKDEARTFILANESDDRRYYSGYAGPWGIKDVYALYVSLRCMEIREDCCLMHAGGGLLPDSVEEKEWEETVAKMEAMRALVVRR